MFDDVVLLLGLVVLAFWAGWKLGSRWTVFKIATVIADRAKLTEIVEEIKEIRTAITETNERPEGMPEDSIEIEVEKENGVYYLYRKSNNQFLGQGPTLMEALELVKKRFPNESFWGGIEKELADKWGTTKEIDSQKS